MTIPNAQFGVITVEKDYFHSYEFAEYLSDKLMDIMKEHFQGKPGPELVYIGGAMMAAGLDLMGYDRGAKEAMDKVLMMYQNAPPLFDQDQLNDALNERARVAAEVAAERALEGIPSTPDAAG